MNWNLKKNTHFPQTQHANKSKPTQTQTQYHKQAHLQNNETSKTLISHQNQHAKLTQTK